MIRKALETTLLPLLLLAACALSHAQSIEATATQAEKRDLVKQLLDLTNSRQTSEALFAAQFESMEKQLPEIEWQAISALDDVKKLTPAQRDQLRGKINESATQRSQRIKTLFLQRIDLKQLVEDISYSVYDKHFTVAELRDLVGFYKSDTGKKVIAESPALYAETVAKAGEMIMPRVSQIMDEIQKDETRQWSHEIERLLESTSKQPPPAKRTGPRKRPAYR